jgi:hypothetical protein
VKHGSHDENNGTEGSHEGPEVIPPYFSSAESDVQPEVSDKTGEWKQHAE